VESESAPWGEVALDSGSRSAGGEDEVAAGLDEAGVAVEAPLDLDGDGGP
jgi:hypothetical protein